MLRTLGAAAVGAAAGGCGLLRPHPGAAPRRALVPVAVDPDRVVRTLVGHRPFRRPGFRVEAETVAGKRVVHNYGHGGCGVTLSWGSAELALEEAGGAGPGSVAVLGCGVLGLATARLLQERGARVAIYARDLPPHTTSNASGAVWYPSLVVRPSERTEAFTARFERAARLSHRRFREMEGPRYGVRWIEQYWLAERPFEWGWDRALLADLFPGTRVLDAGEHPFASPFVIRDRTLLVEPDVYLAALLEDFVRAGGTVERRAFGSAAELGSLPEPLVFNCTGLGSRALFGDESLVAIKGQLLVLAPQPAVDYVAASDDLYMFPRSDGIVLGGTFEPDVWDLEPNQAEAGRVLRGHAALFGAMRG